MTNPPPIGEEEMSESSGNPYPYRMDITMKKYRRRERTVQAITFEELVEFGRRNGKANIVNGMPWSFDFRGFPITHENDECYLLPAPGLTMRFNRGDMLVIEKDQIYPLPPDTFAYFYEPAEPDVL